MQGILDLHHDVFLLMLVILVFVLLEDELFPISQQQANSTTWSSGFALSVGWFACIDVLHTVKTMHACDAYLHA